MMTVEWAVRWASRQLGRVTALAVLAVLWLAGAAAPALAHGSHDELLVSANTQPSWFWRLAVAVLALQAVAYARWLWQRRRRAWHSSRFGAPRSVYSAIGARRNDSGVPS